MKSTNGYTVEPLSDSRLSVSSIIRNDVLKHVVPNC